MVQEQWLQLKSEVFIGLLHENCYIVVAGGGGQVGDKNFVGGLLGGTFPVGGGVSKFLASGEGTLPPSLQLRKPWLYDRKISYSMCH